MFSYIKGKIAELTDGGITIEVGGIGYDVQASLNTVGALVMGAEAKVFTHLKAGEDGVTLYGFSAKEERAMFLRLIEVSGIGCKSALGILSGITLNNLASAIASGDAKKLAQVKGVGKKTAERIILELKEKVSAGGSDDLFGAPPMAGAEGDTKDAIDALRALGISTDAAYKAVMKAKLTAKNIEELISLSLKNLNY